ncbi:MAG TPA: sigma-54 dependent transcriptional regulator [Syntrophorhabdaceae bacterium]|nr:sigma-54 dependent transcriptional regulator [Syntrophorhabdaceae bacterium]
MSRVLVVDDDEIFSSMLSEMVERTGHEATVVNSVGEGLARISSETFDVVFLDIHLPDGNGLSILPKIQALPSPPEIIIITGYGDLNGAELAIKNGVWDYIQKCSTVKEMTLALIRALQYREEKAARVPPVALKRDGIIGNSLVMKHCLNQVAQAAQSDASVLITGETGTGKELIAWAIHNNSKRSEKSFIVVDCASLPETLVESILFGHEKGAFTGADKARDGLIRQAHGGTLFLDEIGELPAALQKSFLRVLQEHKFRPLGSDKEIASDFRLICATNKHLEAMAESGQFREDLLFRTRTLEIRLAPLREHSEDIKELLVYYLGKLCERYGIGTKGYAPEFLKSLMDYRWPGNIRELIGTLEKSISEAFHEPTLYPKHLPVDIRIKLKKTELERDPVIPEIPAVEEAFAPAYFPTLKDFRKDATFNTEREYLENLMKYTENNMKEVCRISGLSKPRLYALRKKLNMS